MILSRSRFQIGDRLAPCDLAYMSVILFGVGMERGDSSVGSGVADDE